MPYLEYEFWDYMDWDTLDSYSLVTASWKLDLVVSVDSMYRSFLDVVQLETARNRDLGHYKPWIFTLCVDLTMDKINIVSEEIVFEEMKIHEDTLQFLLQLSQKINVYLAMIRNEDFQNSVTDYIEQNLDQDIDCLYRSMAARNLTFFTPLIDVITKEILTEHYLDFAKEIIEVINSAETETNVNAVLNAVKRTARNTDFDEVKAKVFLSFMKARSLVQEVDFADGVQRSGQFGGDDN